MKQIVSVGILVVGILLTGIVFADNDCVDSVADWQPRETLRLQLEARGWTIQRIKVDDGCYEVKGVDRNGNKMKAKYAPASLRIHKIEIDFLQGNEADNYLVNDGKTK